MFRLSFLLLLPILGIQWVEAIDDEDTQEHWDAFKVRYNKQYDSKEEEEKSRDNFEKNLLHVALHNVKDEHDYDKDVHQYSDLPVEEQIKMLCGMIQPTEERNYEYKDFSISERALPSSVDWVTAGKVTPVKDQGSCGSCWSFSAAQAIESAYSIKTNQTKIFSEQQMVDCAGEYDNNGCDGGWPQNGFEYLKNEGGISEEKDYPYTAEEGTCSIKENSERVEISDYVMVGPAGDEDAVANALATYGPLTCGIHVSQNFMYYSGGIFTDIFYWGQPANHAVLLVGYGTEDGKDFWKIKNSWGPSWGEDGYIRIRRNWWNHLRVASHAAYPIMA